MHFSMEALLIIMERKAGNLDMVKVTDQIFYQCKAVASFEEISTIINSHPHPKGNYISLFQRSFNLHWVSMSINLKLYLQTFYLYQNSRSNTYTSRTLIHIQMSNSISLKSIF